MDRQNLNKNGKSNINWIGTHTKKLKHSHSNKGKLKKKEEEKEEQKVTNNQRNKCINENKH